MGLGLENPLHIAIVVVVVALLFGAKKLPEMGRGLGEGMREFKDGVTGRRAEPVLASGEPEQDGRVPER
jgi:sec-independent protein translocase protein TatA